MLISRVPEDGAGRGEAAGDIARNCQTASELFDLMTRDHDFEAGDDPLSTSDLVLLYKNIDLGNQLMSNVRTNQYVETVYHDDPETDSDLSESCSSEELRNIMMANKERIDLLADQASFNSLSHKLGDLEIQVSNISTDLYDDRHFLYKDPFVKEQLQKLQLISKTNEFETNLLPTSLLDYICSRRFEDNYNFYMDNVITYVTHTIDQLKRISNGDYLPDKVKEKWRESDMINENSSKVLNTSISMPLQRKRVSLTSSWDDMVRTEVDLRSLVKLLEKKVVIEVPRMICGSYKFFSKFRADKLVISCERKKREAGARATPRINVVLRVQSAAAGQLASNVASIMLPQLEHHISDKDCKEVMPLECQNVEQAALSPRVIELSDLDEKTDDKSSVKSDECGSLCSVSDDRDGDYSNEESLNAAIRPGSPKAVARMLSKAARVVCTEAASNHATPNDLHISMINLDRQALTPEESTVQAFYAKAKKKSPERPRVKSPYENKSYILEERKRRKLLEVRERRERRKRASNENSKVSKHKAFPQAVSSVTKLSITNKAFYNSIYGRNMNGENTNRNSGHAINNGRKGTQKINGVIQEDELESEGDAEERGDAQPDKTLKKICTNFLDDTETEMSYLQSKQDSDFLRVSTSTSVVSTESATNLCTQSDYYSSLTSFNMKGQESSNAPGKLRPVHEGETKKSQDVILKNPANSPKGDCDKVPAVECRRSLEKIYTLMQKLHQIEANETSKKKSTNESRGIGSESGTSLKRRVSFSNPRYEKHPDEIRKERDEDLHAVAVPKVVISAKLQTGKSEDKKERKTRTPRVKTIPENPLKAISQLLHEFDNVQKSRPKIADPKSINRSMSTENTEQPVKMPKRRSRIESPVKDDPKVTTKMKSRFGREERSELKSPVLDKKITDLIDEVKEARGEAVRGPPRFSSRLNALAQPKRAYVQALAEEFPRRQPVERAARPSSHTPRTRRRAPDAHVSPASVRAPNSSLERAAKPRHSAASSPDAGRRAPPSFAEVAANTLHTLEPRPARAPAERPAPARAPLLPRDIQLPSQYSSPATDDDAPQSRSIGIKLHRLVRAMLDTERPASAHADSDISSLPPEEDPIQTQTVLELTDCVSSMEEVTCDQSVVEVISREKISDENQPDEQFEALYAASQDNSVTELEMLEHALHRSLSSGAFAGRLRVNKLTLSPRPSLQQVMMHQSGDTTLLLKSSLHQKIQVTCQSDETSDLMGLLSTTRVNCGFSGFPLQISTVGYAFPTFQCELKKMTPEILRTERFSTSDAGTSYEVNEPSQASVCTVLQIEGVKKEEGCQCAMSMPVPGDTDTITTVCAPKKNIETAPNKESTVSVSPSFTWNRDEGITSHSDQTNDLPSDYTASFDILVGLLNEIQKITTCGCDATGAETVSEPRDLCSRGNLVQMQAPDDKGKEGHKNCVSLYMSNSHESSDDRLEVPETNPVSAEIATCKPVCEDKEVLARVEHQQATASTSQQASLSNDTATTSTCTINVPTVTCSVSALAENCEIGCNTSIQPDEKIIEQPGIETNRASVKSLVPYYNNMFRTMIEKKKEELRPFEHSVSFPTRTFVQKNKVISKKGGEVEIINRNEEVKEFRPDAAGLDSTLKVKRDILVTFYSILVLTVFAALALPEMLQFA